MGSRHISSIEVNRLHGAYDVVHHFDPLLNVIYGPNGAGKSTLLHILANALGGDYERFLYLQFDSIIIRLSDDVKLLITRRVTHINMVHLIAHVNDELIMNVKATFNRADDRPPRTTSIVRSRMPISRAKRPDYNISYFPAFRSMLDAWVSAVRDKLLRPYNVEKSPTDFARRLFGQFVPELKYLSLFDIEEKIQQEIADSGYQVALKEAEHMTGAMIEMFKAILGTSLPEGTKNSIKSSCGKSEAVLSLLGKDGNSVSSRFSEFASSQGAESDLNNMPLSHSPELLRSTLEKIAADQESAVSQLRLYFDNINFFLSTDSKKLVVTPDGSVKVFHEVGNREVTLQTLSSGERQIVAMVYEATHMREKDVVLIDEPELSLHVDWQRPLISRMACTMGEKQIIVTTHSPVIGADVDSLQELKIQPTSYPQPPDEFISGGWQVRINNAFDEDM